MLGLSREKQCLTMTLPHPYWSWKFIYETLISLRIIMSHGLRGRGYGSIGLELKMWARQKEA